MFYSYYAHKIYFHLNQNVHHVIILSYLQLCSTCEWWEFPRTLLIKTKKEKHGDLNMKFYSFYVYIKYRHSTNTTSTNQIIIFCISTCEWWEFPRTLSQRCRLKTLIKRSTCLLCCCCSYYVTKITKRCLFWYVFYLFIYTMFTLNIIVNIAITIKRGFISIHLHANDENPRERGDSVVCESLNISVYFDGFNPHLLASLRKKRIQFDVHIKLVFVLMLILVLYVYCVYCIHALTRTSERVWK